jgi:hypothetical protein
MMSRYTHHDSTENIVGYIVNVHDAVNYDIDLLFDDELRKKYWNVITNTYVYTGDDMVEHTGTTYRCRLKGIGINSPLVFPQSFRSPSGLSGARGSKGTKPRTSKKTRKFQSPALREATITMIRQFDRFNGWVICTVSDVDVYRRLLVTMIDPISRRDLRDILFTESPALFCPYELEGSLNDDDDDASLSSESDIGEISDL